MPDSKEISALLIAEQITENDLLETSIPNAMTETGYVSRKITFGAFGAWIAKTLQFASDLRTTSKTIIGAINELAQGSGQSLDALNDVDIDTQTLTNGQGIVYDATSQKWKNGSVSGGGHTYSTTEQVVGTWIDGSPVYEKTQYISALPSSVGDWVNYPHGISNFDRLISVSATAYNANIPQQLNIPHVSATTGAFPSAPQITISVSDTNIAFIVGQDRSSWEAYVTIRYTKTTI